ncbi:NifB/NifX family molybdenum-iron cluster-binding protein [Desulfosarcina sp.]|uniref:NifB/NifX family molybdenum-iron cluster-binding protein n=1 Tax=Desulfosarcina sp. TaxID=2027861 RepID=UPI0029BCEF77|nr:NifB/NifX family molybdenum-iron cluster-binding protein [Desulfosarcina sp.]MDX2451802.1 NifB/NifX family molybdenum-iron cluster-binding protein [Desulfosarcina sp.]MDX2489586.1 NifB/NifX family molybdenum-iron cluster-binding protein [Desulfosarcina sp.]
MKVAISAAGKNLESTIDERFGRCRYFIILETDDMSYEVIENTNADLSTSAGIQSASLVSSKGVEAVITGNCGPKAMQVFAATTIEVIIGQHGMIKDVLEKFKRGDLNPSTRGNVPGKTRIAQTESTPGVEMPGMNVDGGRGMGGGGGRGMGGGGGRGMGGGGGGRGMGGRCRSLYGAGPSGVQNTAGNLSGEQELAQLQQQADELKKQIDAIHSRMKSLS